MRQLSGLDASFLWPGRPEMPMHVGALRSTSCRAEARTTSSPICAPHRRRACRWPGAAPQAGWMPLNLAAPAWVDAEPDLEEHIVEIRLPPDSGTACPSWRSASANCTPCCSTAAAAVEVPRLRRPRAGPEGGKRVAVYPSCTMPRSMARRRWRWPAAILDLGPELGAIEAAGAAPQGSSLAMTGDAARRARRTRSAGIWVKAVAGGGGRDLAGAARRRPAAIGETGARCGARQRARRRRRRNVSNRPGAAHAA